jgi:hypothetical protein
VLHVSNKFGIFECRHRQQQTLHKKKKESPAFLDPQMVIRTHITLARKNVVAYFVKATSHYKYKEMLVIPLNTGDHWVLLLVCTTYDLVWYCDSSRPTDSNAGKRLTRVFSDVMFILDE